MADALDREQRAVAQLTKAQAVAARELSAAKRAAAVSLAPGAALIPSLPRHYAH